MTARSDAALGLSALALGSAYFVLAVGIEDSLLADAIGAGGVPKGIAALIAGAGALLLVRSLPGLRHLSDGSAALAPHLGALGLLGLLAAYVVLLPILGYAISIFLLAVAIASYAGAPRRPPLLLFGGGTALVLWATFVGVLGVPLPLGRVFGG